jgi:hypothetical protein
MENKLLKLVYRSLDFTLSKRHRRRLDRALAESERLRQHKKEILALRQAVIDSAARGFRPQFAERVMSRIRSAPVASDPWKALLIPYQWFFGRLIIASFLVLIVLISIVVVQDGLFPKNAVFYISGITIDRILLVPVF